MAIPPDRSLLVFDRHLSEFPFNWHHPPEFQLTLTVNSRGMRFVGDHVGQYEDGDLVLVAPNLPQASDRRPLATGEVAVSNLPCDKERLQKVLDHLHRHYDQPLRLKPLCDLVHPTESQLQRVFKRSARMSISAYVLQLRLGRACQMLVQTDIAVGRIATDCGFCDAAGFARRFRKSRPPLTAKRFAPRDAGYQCDGQ